MIPVPLPSREEIHTAYLQSEEAVVALVEGLFTTLLTIISQQQETITRLEARIQVLEDQAAKNSRNSSKPPASAACASRAARRVADNLDTPGTRSRLSNDPIMCVCILLAAVSIAEPLWVR
jgi:hypothetical protein